MNLDDLKSLANELPEHQPTEDRAQELRASLLTAVNKEQIRKPLFSPWLAACAIAAAAAIAFYAGSRSAISPAPTPIAHAESPALTSPDGARFDRYTSAVLGTHVEEVHLHEGSLQIAADSTQRPLHVVTKNARLHGVSSFKVEASDDTLQAVHVQSGRLEVRIENQPPIVLGPGESWIKPEQQVIELAVRANNEADQDEAENENAGEAENMEPTKPANDVVLPQTAEQKSEPSKAHTADKTARKPLSKTSSNATSDTHLAKPALEPMPQPVVQPSPSEPEPSAIELAFDAGYRAVKRGDYVQGLQQLELAIAETGDVGLRADARYWRIVALARSGRGPSSQSAMQEFMRTHPANSRAGEVATMLGWLYVEQGKKALAKPLFTQGSLDASSRVRTSAQAGLKTIAN